MAECSVFTVAVGVQFAVFGLKDSVLLARDDLLDLPLVVKCLEDLLVEVLVFELLSEGLIVLVALRPMEC